MALVELKVNDIQKSQIGIEILLSEKLPNIFDNYFSSVLLNESH